MILDECDGTVSSDQRKLSPVSKDETRKPLGRSNFKFTIMNDDKKTDDDKTEASKDEARKPLVRTNFEFTIANDDKKTDYNNSKAIGVNRRVLKKGTMVIAKNGDDGKWRKAVVHEVVAPDKFYIVRYEDNGQYGGAPPEDIQCDEGNEESTKGAFTQQVLDSEEGNVVWNVGDQCIARWVMDSVWYNAKIVEVSSRSIIVKFIDYGNEDSVNREDLVKTVGEIPQCSLIDENVEKLGINSQMKSEIVVPEKLTTLTNDESEFTNKTVDKVPRPLKPGS